MSDATIIIVVQLITAAVVTIFGYLTRQEVIGLKPEIVDVRKKLEAAEAVIAKQDISILALRDELANRIPQMSKQQFNEEYTAMPSYRKADKPKQE